MNTAAGRRPNLGDLMILVAALALGLAEMGPDVVTALPDKLRAWEAHAAHLSGRRVVREWVGVVDARVALLQDVVNYVSRWIAGPLLGLTPASIAIRLRRPRPDPRALRRQPGFVACVAAIVGFVAFLESTLFELSLRPEVVVGGTVALSWLVLATSRKWHAEKGWIDRLGRLVGVGWIVLAAGGIARDLIY